MKKTFDCVKMKDDAQLGRAKELEGMSAEERMHYFDRAHHALLERQAQLRHGVATASTDPVHDKVTHILDEIARQMVVRK